MLPSILLGTGASEAIPCGMCDCEVCRRARRLKGKDSRTRSDFLIDETAMIDYSPDLYYQLLQANIHLRELRHIFLTHFHEDHISVPELGCRGSGIPNLDKTVNIYGSASALEQIDLLFGRYKDQTRPNAHNYFEKYILTPLEPFKEYLIDEMQVTPILSSHYGYGVNEVGYNYIITDRRKKTFLYAVDTGWYWEETWDYLKANPKELDYIVIECTYGDFALPYHQEGHLDISNMLEMVKVLASLGWITRQTPIILSHICHLHSKSYDETQAMFADCGWNIKVGYDSMVISN